jgi:cytochrome c oxidase subunit 2
MRVSARRRIVVVGAAVIGAATAAAISGCTRSSPSTVDTAGPAARDVAGLWWLMFWIAAAVLVVVVALLAVGIIRRRGPAIAAREGDAMPLVVFAGVVGPLVILALVYVTSLGDLSRLALPRRSGLTVEVTGHQWWWGVRYPATGAVTANEIHIPVGVQVRVRLQTADVLHSFWIPQLAPKTDLIAGRTNDAWLQADRPGVYHGQCAEYCGLQHAHMVVTVIAQSRGDFDAWQARISQPHPPQTPAQQHGLQIFESSSCAACHAIRGTSADGRVGPDLSEIGARLSLGAGTVANDPQHMTEWITNPQTVKPGSLMPPQQLNPDQLADLVTYLQSLR